MTRPTAPGRTRRRPSERPDAHHPAEDPPAWTGKGIEADGAGPSDASRDASRLRTLAAALPRTPGVYLFHADSETRALPLYIGKSVDLRARVLSHLRDPAEQHWVQRTEAITWIETPGEVGALLLEARLIKERQPLFNQRLRRSRALWAWQVDEAGRPELVHSRAMDFASGERLFGLHASPHAAREHLVALAQAHQLCLQQLGLEAASGPGRPCFARQLRRCQGACCGDETAAAHARRLLDALADQQIRRWPWPGAVALIEGRGRGARAVHVVLHWCHLGTVADLRAARQLARKGRVAADFDADGYKILVRPLLQPGPGQRLVALEDVPGDAPNPALPVAPPAPEQD